MGSRVDPRREVVRGERRVWSFALDCRADSATIGLGGKVYRVRPLRWREKRNLSRYYRLGDDFVERQFVKLCLVEDLPLPTEPEEYEALQALARWINAPGDAGASLPLDPGLLASVTMAVARTAGVTSSELDLETADFVEQLWRERIADPTTPSGVVSPEIPQPPRQEDAATSPVLPDPGELNRILILPDPPRAADLAGVEVTSDLPVSEASVPVASADGDLPTVPVPTATFSAAPAQAQASRAPARFRVRLPASVDAASRPPDSPSQSIEPPVSTRLPLVPGVAEPVRTAAVPFELPRHPIGSNGTGPPDAAVADTQPWPGLARATGVAAAETDSRGRSRSVPATPLYRDDAASPAAPINAPDDPNVDDLFDRWAEQLEQAAEQLGIESES